jgi:hypothetical protein
MFTAKYATKIGCSHFGIKFYVSDENHYYCTSSAVEIADNYGFTDELSIVKKDK